MLPGQKYTPEDVLRILWHRKWLIIVPLVTASVCSYVVAKRLPSLYRSETLLQLMPQRIPENYIPKTGTTSINDRLNSIRQVILSRSRLESIIQEFNLYPEARRIGVMEDVVERMRAKDIIVTVERGDAFRLSYAASEPRTAQKVAEELASLFIDENTREREALADQTSQFLDAKLEEAKRRLLENEKKLEDYRRRHSGELPSQVQGNIQAMSSARLELQALTESMNRDRDRRLSLEQQIANLQDAAAASSTSPASSVTTEATGGGSTADQLEAQRARLQLLRIRYKEDHPDVGTAKRVIRELELKLQAEAGSVEATPGTAVPVATPAEILRQTRLRDLGAELQNVDRQLEVKVTHERKLREVVASLQARIDAAPTRESELIELTRDYETISALYRSLAGTRESARMAGDVVRQQIGEQFKILDPARLPERPFSPDRPRILMMGSVLGLGLGLALIALLEYRDSTFKTEDDVLRVLQLPVLALVPIMASDLEVSTRRRRKFLVALAAVVMVVTSAAAVALWKFQGS